MEEARIKAEDSVVSTFRASICHSLLQDTEESVELGRRVEKRAADTKQLLNEANHFLMEGPKEPARMTTPASKCTGIGLQLARRMARLARAESVMVLSRVDRLLEVQIARNVPLPLSPSGRSEKLKHTSQRISRHGNDLAIDEDEEALGDLPAGSCSPEMEDLIKFDVHQGSEKFPAL